MNATNDNDETDPLPFIHLSALVANVVGYLLEGREEHQERSDRNAGCGSAEDEQTDRDGCEVDESLDNRVARGFRR